MFEVPQAITFQQPKIWVQSQAIDLQLQIAPWCCLFRKIYCSLMSPISFLCLLNKCLLNNIIYHLLKNCVGFHAQLWANGASSNKLWIACMWLHILIPLIGHPGLFQATDSEALPGHWQWSTVDDAGFLHFYMFPTAGATQQQLGSRTFHVQVTL